MSLVKLYRNIINPLSWIIYEEKRLNSEQTFFERLNHHYNELSKKQKKTANYIKENYRTVAMMSIIPLSKAIGVSEATVVRFAQLLGYSGFIDMMNDIKSFIKKELSTLERFENYHKDNAEKSSINNVLSNNLNVLNKLVVDLTDDFVEQIVEQIIKAKCVVIIGFESTASLAQYFGYHLSRCGKEVKVINENTQELFSILGFLDKNDFCISISVPRHVEKQLTIMEYLKSKKIDIFSITDSPISRIADLSKYSIYIPMTDSLLRTSSIHVGVISIIQILIMQFIIDDDVGVKNSLNALELFHNKFNTFHIEK